MFFVVLNDIVDKYNNTYHEFSMMLNLILMLNTMLILMKKILHLKLVISKIKKAVPLTYVISDLSGEEIVGSFYEKELQKNNQEEFRIEKVIKRKGNKLYVKWKGYDDFFNSWIDRKDII